MSWLRKYREEQRLKTIRKRYGGRWNMALQCRDCDYFRLGHSGTIKTNNYGCRYPGRLTVDQFKGHTCLVWRERGKANPIKVGARTPK